MLQGVGCKKRFRLCFVPPWTHSAGLGETKRH